MSSAKRSGLQKFVRVALILYASFSLTGCSQPTPPPEPVTIDFGYVGFDNRTSERQYYQDLADQFHQENPNITVKVGFSSLYSAFYEDEFSKDVLLIPDFPYDDFYSGMLDIYTRAGQSWAIPASADPYVL